MFFVTDDLKGLQLESKNKFNRTTRHLGDHAGAYAVDCLQAVEDLFEGKWLRKNQGHRLQLLWARRDHLATSELYALGKAIRNLQPKHSRWLESTARRLKKNSVDSHGLITEILVCGSMNGRDADVLPAKNDQPGFDLTIRFSEKFSYVISVKNHDISIHEKAFHKSSANLRNTFIERMKVLGTNGRLFVSCDDYMDEHDFDMCSDFIRNRLESEGVHEVVPNRLVLHYAMLVKEKREFAKTFTSSAVIIYCRQHPNEQINFIDKLIKAADNMKKHVPRKATRLRLLRMRVHASADIISLEKIAQEMINKDEDCGFDGVILTQSNGVRSNDDTHIHTVFRFALSTNHHGILEAGKLGHLLSIEFGIGSLGQTPIETQLVANNKEVITLPRDQYIYQKTDYFYLMEKDEKGLVGTLESPASGVHFHSVMEMNGVEVALQAISPISEDVLIV